MISVSPMAPTLATAIDWSGSISDAGDVVEVVEQGEGLGRHVHLAEADRIEPALQRGDDGVDVLADLRDRRDELGDRVRQGLRHDETDDDQGDDDDRVDEDGRHDPRQARDDRRDPGHDRADDEREEPGQEERQQDVAERGQRPRRSG